MLAVALVLLAPRVTAQSRKPQEGEVKAAYLLNFGRFTKWPADRLPEGDRFTICVLGVLGRDPLGSALDGVVSGETIDGQHVVVRRLAKAEEAQGCRVLFISGSESTRVRQILRQIDGAPTLTVSDSPDFIALGGMIQFVIAENRVRFSINVEATEQAGLALSSELLRVAVSVKNVRTPGA